MLSASDTTTAVSLPLVRSDEERLMRETVASICSGYGPAYSRRKHAEGRRPPSSGTTSRARATWA